ncbi:MAG: response regulator [Pseudomonadota bacterium]|nr:response regulator [Pseudomonadota bacterium]MDE3037341.1 response regulator [Pseudomonadota bacterium]
MNQYTPQPKPHILIVDDDDRLRSLLKKFLGEQGFIVTPAADSREARRKLGWFVFDLIVLDVMMPGESGLSLLESLRNVQPAPVLMLSAMGESDDRIRGFETGAEDYLAKPFEPKELVLRIRAILRRAAAQTARAKSVAFGEYRFDFVTGQLKRGQENISLTSSEAAILKRLAENAGKPIARDALSMLMSASSERAVDVQITRLRKKIGESAGRPVYLQTVRGAGYVLYAG